MTPRLGIWTGLLLAALVGAGCSPAPMKVNSDPTAPPPAEAPPGAKPVDPGSQFVDASRRNPAITPGPPADKPPVPEGSKVYKGTLEGGPDPKGMKRDDRTGPPPLTPELAERLGGYRLTIKDGRCTFHATGVNVEGPCSEKGDSLVLTPETVAGKPKEEAEKDAAMASLAGPWTFVKDKDGFVVEFDGERQIRFAPSPSS